MQRWKYFESGCHIINLFKLITDELYENLLIYRRQANQVSNIYSAKLFLKRVAIFLEHLFLADWENILYFTAMEWKRFIWDNFIYVNIDKSRERLPHY